MEGDGSVGTVAGDGDAKKFFQWANGKFLNTGPEISLELVKDKGVEAYGKEVVNVEGNVDNVGCSWDGENVNAWVCNGADKAVSDKMAVNRLVPVQPGGG